MKGNKMTMSLAGIRVIDFTRVISGPAATRQLALQGADTIKIEPPDEGDIMRDLMAEGELAKHRISPIFQYLNTGKRSIVLDLKKSEGLAIARRLINEADVVVENYRPGVMTGLGLDATEIRRRRPSLIWCSISGYGQTGPKSRLAAYDGPLQADSGIMSVNGKPDGDPTRLGIMAVDMFVGSNAATAILSALLRREKTGEGQTIDISMLDGALHLLAPQILNYSNSGHIPRRNGNHTEARLPTDCLFPTTTEPILITAISETQVAALWRLLGRNDLILDERCATGPARLKHRAFVEAEIKKALAVNTADYWEKTIRAAGIPCARVRTVPEVVADDQVAAGNRLQCLQLPEGVAGDPATILNGGYLADVDGPVSRTAPLYGGDTRSILTELGLTEAQISALADTEAIRY